MEQQKKTINLKRLKLLYKIKNNNVNVLKKELQELNNNYHNELEVLKKLEEYNKQYLVSITPAKNKNYTKNHFLYKNSFVNYLEQAIFQQKNILEQLERKVDEKRLNWIVMQKKLEALSDYIIKIEKNNLYKQNIKEQKYLDFLVNDYFNQQNYIN